MGVGEGHEDADRQGFVRVGRRVGRAGGIDAGLHRAAVDLPGEGDAAARRVRFGHRRGDLLAFDRIAAGEAGKRNRRVLGRALVYRAAVAGAGLGNAVHVGERRVDGERLALVRLERRVAVAGAALDGRAGDLPGIRDGADGGAAVGDRGGDRGALYG